MILKLREDAKYAVGCLTSMGVRITPENRMGVQSSHHFYMQATSAETNVCNIASSLGCRTLALTKFVEGSPIAAFIRSELRARNIDYEGISVPQGGPWGYRHQFNIADSGYGLRGARVFNDRAGEVGRTLSAEEFDTERIFGREGMGIFHISGLIAAMSESTTRCCIDLAKEAKRYGTLVSFDLNYRASFWKGRETELRSAFQEIAGLADILVGNEEDFQLCLGFRGPETGGKAPGSEIESFRQMIREVKAAYPNATVFATTLREVISANRNLWGAVMLTGDDWYVEQPREIDILDRIGGGDAFTGGLLYGILRGMEPAEWIRFGWACGALAVTSLNDYGEPADEKQVWDIYAGNARVQR